MNPFRIAVLSIFILSNLSAQKINEEIKLDNEQPFLVGQIELKALQSNSYQSWYENNYGQYQVDTKTIASLKKTLSEYQILLFMGTWCGDSKREVPRFIKILETMDFPMKNLKIVAVDRRKDRYKTSPTGEEWALKIKRVPTFIFYKNGKETNRIIESPVVSLEADIKAIITDTTYVPNYPKSLHFD